MDKRATPGTLSLVGRKKPDGDEVEDVNPDKRQTDEATGLRRRAEELYRAKEDATGLRRTEFDAHAGGIFRRATKAPYA
jgi:hypothetical protein